MTFPAATTPPPIGPLPERLRVLYPFADRFFPLPGGEALHYIDEGPAAATDGVIMIHGNPSWSFLYRNLVLALRGSRRCLVPDHLGCGLSTRPARTIRLAEHQENLVRWIDALQLESFDLVVHDWGGPIGLGAVLSQFNDRLRRVVILNTAAFVSHRIPLRIAACKIPLLGPSLIRGFNLFAVAATRMAVCQPMVPAVREGFLWPYRKPGTRRATADFVRDIPLGSWHPSFRTLRTIEADLNLLRQKEVLLFWGLRDFCFSPPFLAAWRQRLPDARVQAIGEAGHYVLEDTTAEQLRELAGFLTAKVSSG